MPQAQPRHAAAGGAGIRSGSDALVLDHRRLRGGPDGRRNGRHGRAGADRLWPARLRAAPRRVVGPRLAGADGRGKRAGRGAANPGAAGGGTLSDGSEIVARWRGLRIAVWGDFVADEFVHGEIARVSREAPVLILKQRSRSVTPGGAGNAAMNLAALGARVAVIGVVGDDET